LYIAVVLLVCCRAIVDWEAQLALGLENAVCLLTLH